MALLPMLVTVVMARTPVCDCGEMWILTEGGGVVGIHCCIVYCTAIQCLATLNCRLDKQLRKYKLVTKYLGFVICVVLDCVS